MFFISETIITVAAYFEKDEYQKCIEDCEMAVEEGRKHNAAFKIIARYFVLVIHCIISEVCCRHCM